LAPHETDYKYTKKTFSSFPKIFTSKKIPIDKKLPPSLCLQLNTGRYNYNHLKINVLLQKDVYSLSTLITIVPE